MKNFKIILIALLVTTFMVASAFRISRTTTKEKAAVTMAIRYNGISDDIADLKNPDNWSTGTSGGECTGSQVPCVLQYPGTQQDFEDFLNGVSAKSDFDEYQHSSQDIQ
ncbi:MAG: hypothetical protein JWN76_421 [Chitinophagaceae bacterium]|nr:hypothetical protein [Chitinophagaceae bacterium]